MNYVYIHTHDGFDFLVSRDALEQALPRWFNTYFSDGPRVDMFDDDPFLEEIHHLGLLEPVEQ